MRILSQHRHCRRVLFEVSVAMTLMIVGFRYHHLFVVFSVFRFLLYLYLSLLLVSLLLLLTLLCTLKPEVDNVILVDHADH